MQTLEATTTPGNMTEEQRAQVLVQMNRLLESHQFKNSKRYPALLRFIVEETLAGRGEFLKERLLGIRVFDRPADYDTAADPIVRVTVAEIRKRIAQYYHDEEHDAEIRIELLPGHYAPEFRPRREVQALREPVVEQAVAVVAPPATDEKDAARSPKARKGLRLGLELAAMVLAVLGGILLVRWLRPSASDELWSPILASKRPVLFCLPTGVGGKLVSGEVGFASLSQQVESTPLQTAQGRPVGPTFLDHESLGENVVYSDMLATLNVVNVLAVHHHDYHVRLNVATSLDDLRHGPAVLIGGLDNQWSMRALKPLQFHFDGSDEQGYWIADAKDPRNTAWRLDLKQKYLAVTRDYAILARIHNEQTGEVEMIIAGIGMSGTAAAGEFVSDEQRMKELRQRIGPGLANDDFEVVLSTDVVSGIAGSPKILAVAVW